MSDTFTCPQCGMTSGHPADVEQGYCGNCHRWTGACNLRPPEGHPMHDWGVACHLPQDHLDYSQPHSWDIVAAFARHEILTAAMSALRALFPERKIERFDTQLPHPLVTYDVDEQGNRGRPYRAWDLPAGPWLVVRYEDGEEFAIWKVTGAVYRVGSDGAVEEDPIITLDDSSRTGR